MKVESLRDEDWNYITGEQQGMMCVERGERGDMGISTNLMNVRDIGD